jgi:hypothetical protein
MRIAFLMVLALFAGCTVTPPKPTTLTALADTELADIGPVLDDLRRETGVSLQLEHRGTVQASEDIAAGATGHDLAWLSIDRYLRLRTPNLPLSTTTMFTPLVLGVKPGKAAELRVSGPPSWADVAGHAAAGRLRFAMADSRTSGSGLAALICVATAADWDRGSVAVRGCGVRQAAGLPHWADVRCGRFRRGRGRVRAAAGRGECCDRLRVGGAVAQRLREAAGAVGGGPPAGGHGALRLSADAAQAGETGSL